MSIDAAPNADLASRFAATALGHVAREYPNHIMHVLTGPQDARTPRDMHPIFFGSFDWHSCVHGWWTLFTLYRLQPDMSEADAIRATADALFTPENVSGVYLPYMVVDSNVSASVSGKGEIQTRQYTRGTEKNKKTYYDADVYQVDRQVDFTVDDLTMESSAERGNLDTQTNTNNIINAILPFDTKNALKWNASYLAGFTSEKRNLDVEKLRPRLEDQLLSIARAQVEGSVRRYDRGVRWERERVDVHGTRWVSMYLPVWLYSYHQPGRNGGMLHYIAVNGRTGETMGSVPVQQWKLLLAALTTGTIIEALVLFFLVAAS